MMSVFRGSNETPYLLTLTYKPKRAKKVVALVGKGVTFDSGGLSIKSGSGMIDMKMDMAGAAAVLATMQAISKILPDVEVHAYVPATENMINQSATRPGDVVRSLNGKTIEILNTDAEGRLILGDTLVLAERRNPDVIIDLATLTGAVISAIGSDYAGLFSTSDSVASGLSEAAALGGERVWRLPLAPEYRERIKSSIADLKNIGGSEAGSITAALFLREFVEQTAWAHLDIAGTAFTTSDKLATPKGGTGFGVRTLVRYIQGLAKP
jgi:leucyl aminopeptidase